MSKTMQYVRNNKFLSLNSVNIVTGINTFITNIYGATLNNLNDTIESIYKKMQSFVYLNI